jgi:hypothetical protein
LLAITHSQWIHQCSVLHERDAQGLKLKEGQDSTVAIQEQFQLGLDGLHAHNRHYISRGQDCIIKLPAANKKAWLSGVRLAREAYLDSEARESDSMHTFMLDWLSGASLYMLIPWSPQLLGLSQRNPLG